MFRFAVLIILLISPLFIQGQKLERNKTIALDRIVSAYIKQQNIPGLSIAVRRNGHMVWSKGYGFANLENFVPATPDTVYRSASIGKPITATAAMRLVEESKLDIDQPIQKYCAAFPQKPWIISARHLLTHTSGIRHYGGPKDREEQTSTIHYENVEQALAPFKDDKLLFEPGKEFFYSTYGYNVLGCVLEGAAKMSFMEIIRKYVFEPSLMTHSRDDDPSIIIKHRAAGYVLINGQLKIAHHVDMSNRLPAGGYVTTAPDLAAFAEAFIDCKLVSCATRDAMLKHARLNNGDTVNYGLGWSIEEDSSGNPTGNASHGGSSPGVSGMLYIIPKHRLTVVMLTNLENATRRGEIVHTIANLILDSSKQKATRNDNSR